jgi:hypothetical protein
MSDSYQVGRHHQQELIMNGGQGARVHSEDASTNPTLAVGEGVSGSPRRATQALAPDASTSKPTTPSRVDNGGSITSESPVPFQDIEGQSGGKQPQAPSTSPARNSFDFADALLGDSRRNVGHQYWQSWLNKGDLSNVFTFGVFLLGLILRAAVGDSTEDEEGNSTGSAQIANFVFSFGLFGFAGGITNWLAVKMLFDRVGVDPYFLYGSGVIPLQFKAIREALKNMILKMFFDRTFLKKYLNERATGVLQGLDLGQKLKTTIADPEFDGILEVKLTELSTKPEGMLIMTLAPMFGGIPGMVPVLKPFLGAFGGELLKVMVEKLDVESIVSVDTVISEVEKLLNEKLLLITPEMVTRFLRTCDSLPVIFSYYKSSVWLNTFKLLLSSGTRPTSGSDSRAPWLACCVGQRLWGYYWCHLGHIWVWSIED